MFFLGRFMASIQHFKIDQSEVSRLGNIVNQVVNDTKDLNNSDLELSLTKDVQKVLHKKAANITPTRKSYRINYLIGLAAMFFLSIFSFQRKNLPQYSLEKGSGMMEGYCDVGLWQKGSDVRFVERGIVKLSRATPFTFISSCTNFTGYLHFKIYSNHKIETYLNLAVKKNSKGVIVDGLDQIEMNVDYARVQVSWSKAPINEFSDVMNSFLIYRNLL